MAENTTNLMLKLDLIKAILVAMGEGKVVFCLPEGKKSTCACFEEKWHHIQWKPEKPWLAMSIAKLRLCFVGFGLLQGLSPPSSQRILEPFDK